MGTTTEALTLSPDLRSTKPPRPGEYGGFLVSCHPGREPNAVPENLGKRSLALEPHPAQESVTDCGQRPHSPADVSVGQQDGPMTNTPSEPIPVRLIGGPLDWHEATLDIYTAQDLAVPRATLGTCLISNAVSAGHPDLGPRANYSPNTAPWPAHLWFFRGWEPYAPVDPEDQHAEQLQHVDLVVDTDELPEQWTDRLGAEHRGDRIFAHWQATGENDLAPDVWQVEAASSQGSRVWELHHHASEMWEAGPMHGSTS